MTVKYLRTGFCQVEQFSLNATGLGLENFVALEKELNASIIPASGGNWDGMERVGEV